MKTVFFVVYFFHVYLNALLVLQYTLRHRRFTFKVFFHETSNLGLCHIKGCICSAYSLRRQLGISSRQHAFDGFSVASSFIFLSSDTSCSFCESVGTGNLVSGFSKRYSSSGSRKAWLMMFASSWLLQSLSYSMWMWLMTLPELDWDPLRRLPCFHHSFGFSSFMCSTLTL